MADQVCPRCGSAFAVANSGGAKNRKYCGPECSRVAKKAADGEADRKRRGTEPGRRRRNALQMHRRRTRPEVRDKHLAAQRPTNQRAAEKKYVGRTFGAWLVEAFAGTRAAPLRAVRLWRCRCVACGAVAEMSSFELARRPPHGGCHA